MTHDGEVCAALPLLQVSLAAWYCHVHQGWCYSARIHSQTTDEVIDTIHAHDGDLGPFDDPGALGAVWSSTMARAVARIESRTV